MLGANLSAKKRHPSEYLSRTTFPVVVMKL